jgi:hypothetical protein
MYDGWVIIDQIKQHIWLMLLFGALSMGSATLWYVESIRVSEKSKLMSMPFLAVFGWLGHDWSYVMNFNQWFHHWNYWLFKLFWVGMIPLVIIEVIWISQIIRFGRKEFWPSLSQRLWTIAVIAGALGSTVLWFCLKRSMVDPLYLISMQICCILYAASQLTLTLRRKSREGQSLLQVCAAASAFGTWGIASILFLGPFTHDWRWIGMNIVIFSWYCVGIVVLYKQPKCAVESPQMASKTIVDTEHISATWPIDR